MKPLDFTTLQKQFGSQILALAEKYRLENIRVFGSVVRGDAKDSSDVDLLVHPARGCSLFEFMDFEHDVSYLLGGKKIDVLSDRAIHPRLAPYILSEAKALSQYHE